MCVLKQTTHRRRPFDCSAICFNTLPFFYPHKDNPSGRPPVCPMFYVRGRVLVTLYSHVAILTIVVLKDRLSLSSHSLRIQSSTFYFFCNHFFKFCRTNSVLFCKLYLSLCFTICFFHISLSNKKPQGV